MTTSHSTPAGADDEYAPANAGSSDEELTALRNTWRAGQQWQCRRATERWRDLPAPFSLAGSVNHPMANARGLKG